jgi:hypothetical protein
MVMRDPKNEHQNSVSKENGSAEAHALLGHDENCRCKETSQMSPQELLRLMMNDLAFWKKKKKE